MKLFINIIIALILLFKGVYTYSFPDGLIPERILGDPTAKITIEEYASLSCGHCANFHNEALAEIKKEYIDTGKAKLIFHDFPLDRTAMYGSMVSQCMTGEQYFPVLSRLFRKQMDWVQSRNLDELSQAIYSTLKPLGIEKNKITSCLEDNTENNERWEALLKNRKIAMEEREIESTPTFFVNGKRIKGKFNLQSFKENID